MPDRQTATLAWGDGTVEAQSAFTLFGGAFGDAAGSASHAHRYPLAGSYAVALLVAEDDGGADVAISIALLEQVAAALSASCGITPDHPCG